jgi:hypothetical protein
MPVRAEAGAPTRPAATEATTGCRRRPCCIQPGPPVPIARVALAYGLPTAALLAAAGLAAALQLNAAASALVVLPALALAGRLAGRVDGGSRHAQVPHCPTTSTAHPVAKEFPCP